VPLKSGKKNFSYNVKEMMHAGHSQKQSVAVAYKMERKHDHGFYGHLMGGQKGKPIYGGQEEC